MSPKTEYADYIVELLEPIGWLRTSRFFGGIAISRDTVQFAMVMENTLYFVVDDETRPTYAQAGMQPFSYSTKKGRVQVKRYFEVPDEVLADAEQLRQWAKESIRMAGKTAKPKQPKHANP